MLSCLISDIYFFSPHVLEFERFLIFFHYISYIYKVKAAYPYEMLVLFVVVHGVTCQKRVK
jgi:hypothetical protein